LHTTARAQAIGDTIVVQAFDYSQNTYGQGNRQMMVNFPTQAGITYEKIIMKYNMRCKGGAVGNQVPPSGNAGCGEWDYSCNTYITDSSSVDSALSFHPSHIIPGFSGSSFSYTTAPTFSYNNEVQQQVTINSTTSETVGTVGSGGLASNRPFYTQENAYKTQYLWHASELSAQGIVAGNITSLRLNLTNLGSDAQYLRIRLKHSTKSALSAETPDLDSFTEVYFLNTPFTFGSNNLQFHTPFVWNGVDNIIVEFSFNNTAAGTNNTVSADTTSFTSGLYGSAGYSYDFNSTNYFALNNTFSNFSDQISIGFWCYGNENILPTNTSIAYASNSNNDRQVNIHLPWSNGNFYWDCGSGGPYDRITAPMSPLEYKGRWNYWVFTKNSTSGMMRAYLNGIIYSAGSGKTMPIEVDNFRLGSDPNGNNPYFGKVDDFSIWSAELTQTEIQQWMYKNIDASHPKYSSLQAYYKFNEGTGTNCNDAVTTSSSSILAPVWRKHKGIDIFKDFAETNLRPQVSFVQGVYTQSTTTILVTDSTQNNPFVVYSYASNGSSISPVDTHFYYKAGYTYVTDASTAVIVDSVFNPSVDTIDITSLSYYPQSPSRYQIMSFVTPYGNGLNLGPNGKTWTFDVSDYAPILKGSKLMTMDAGGQWQEDMDIKFLFIVGTPPHDVKSISNIWKVLPVGYTSLLNNTSFEPRNVVLNPNAVSYKIRSAITGHGQEGEFIPRNHFINLDGGAIDYNWTVWKACASNPVYPQGGTWIYDRAGWCPGMATDTKEIELPSNYTPGSTVNIDYGISTASGHSDYWVSNQLVSYGSENFNLDAAIIDVMNPSTKVEYARTNGICANPKVIIQNTGKTTLTSATINYWVNDAAVKQVYNWTGALGFMEVDTVSISSTIDLWSTLDSTGNIFYAEIKNPNGGADGYAFNNKIQSPFNLTPIIPRNFYIHFKSNLVAAENEYRVLDDAGNVVFSRSNMNNNTTYRDTLSLNPGCYTFILTDLGEDGINFWANPNAGTGFIRLVRATGTNIITLNPDFGKSTSYNFTVDYPLSYDDVYAKQNLEVYPNPTSTSFNVKWQNTSVTEIILCNAMGQIVQRANSTTQQVNLDVSKLAKGVYYVRAGTEVKSVIVE
jgi:hypothetical protein